MTSIEEKVEEHYKSLLDALGIRHFGKTEEINGSITKALEEAKSKSGGDGNNYPDIKLLLDNKAGRRIPVMIEAKGTKGKLEKLTSDGDIELVSSGKNKNRAVQQYAVNGALHYGLAVLDEGTYNEVVIVGINGATMTENGEVEDPEVKAYYVSEKNDRVPKELNGFDFIQMKQKNVDLSLRRLVTCLCRMRRKRNSSGIKRNCLRKTSRKCIRAFTMIQASSHCLTLIRNYISSAA